MGNKDLKNKKLTVRTMELIEKGKKLNTVVEIVKKQPIEKKMKEKRKREKNVVIDKVVHISTEVDNSIKTARKEKVTKSPGKKNFRSSKNSIALVGKTDKLDTDTSDGFDKQNGKSKKVWKKLKEQSSIEEDLHLLENGGEADQDEVLNVSSADEYCLEGKSKEAKKKKNKKRKRECNSLKEVEKLQEEGRADKKGIYLISSGDEDCSKGMKKWVTEYHQSRQGLEILQQRIDEFLTAHEEHLEEERKEREARAAEGGWTVVTHHKGRKKTTDAESGITVGSVSQAVVEDKMAKKKMNGVGLNFYRFQRKEAQRNEIMMLQSKFEQDKKRIQQLRAARKFRPY